MRRRCDSQGIGLGTAGLEGRAARTCFTIAALGLVLTGLCFSAKAQAVATWPNEDALACDSGSAVRETFVFDPGTCNRIPQERFAQDLADYYISKGFDRNFLTWAPTQVIAPGSATWADCTATAPHPFALCPASNNFHPVNGSVLDNRITARAWNGAFIALVCGNFSQTGAAGPVPTIAGTKYEDLNGNGSRDPGEPGLGGVQITLLRDMSVVARTTTAADGSYAFRLDVSANPNLGPGRYTLREDVPAGFLQTASTGAIVVDYAIGARTFAGNDFGNERLTDLVIQKQASKTTTIAGEDLVWTLTVTSRGLFDTPNVVVGDDVPPGVAAVSQLDPACTLAAGRIACELGVLHPGEVRTLQFRTRLRPDLDRGSTVLNSASVSSSLRDSNPADNTASAVTQVDTRADLATSKTVSTGRTTGGSPVSYGLSVRNNGPSDARDVQLRDPVPADVVILSTSPGAPACTVAAQLVTCGFGTLRPGELRTVTIGGRAAGKPPAPLTPGNDDHLLTVSKSETSVALDAGQTQTDDVACSAGAIAVDGSPRIESVDQGTGDMTSVKVLEARSVALGTFRFVLRNDATGRAQLHLYVTCLSATTTGGSGTAHPIVTANPLTTTRTLAPGRQTITLGVPLDYRAVAPSYAVTSGAARLVASEPADRGWRLTFEVTAKAVVSAAVTPLRTRVAAVDGHSHLLLFAHLEQSVTLPAGGTVDTTLSCADDAKGIVASFDVPAGIIAVGNEPQPKSRVFRLYNGTGQAATARVDLECLADRTSGPVDDVGVVTNTAAATSTTVDPAPDDNAASAAFVVDRAAGSTRP